ncbi:MAG: six-cysteine peptide SCIFF [Desulfitibacter sp. BRH_c19]|nr:MAG: six-cysteine peptide SCIFF [Desulfitibacter sp. BRH_c19]
MARELKHIKTILKSQLQKTQETGGCGKCQVSCQSACKTSCTVGNQICEKN